MMALHLYPVRGSRYVHGLLRVYHDALMEELSVAYDWNDLQADYRLGHLQNVVAPVYNQHLKLHPAIWWTQLERWFLAFEDLSCADLL